MTHDLDTYSNSDKIYSTSYEYLATKGTSCVAGDDVYVSN